MLTVLLWVLCGIGIIFLFVFPGKRKGRPLLSDRETVLSEAAANIASVTLILAQFLFPLYGYVMSPTGNIRPYDGSMEEFRRQFRMHFTEFNVNFLPPFDLLRGNSVYLFVMIIAVFCFFSGMHLYKNGLKIRHKILILIPVLVLIATVVWAYFFRLSKKPKIRPFIRYQIIVQFDAIVRYLLGAFIMIALLYSIYVLLKKLLKNETVPLIVILALSFLAPLVHVRGDGMLAAEPKIGHLLFGPDIPLFPIGMLVMKFKDKLLPRSKKAALKHISLWTSVSAISFCLIFGLQSLIVKLAGVRFSEAYSCFDTPEFRAKYSMLEKIYPVSSIPWLTLGFAMSMLLLALALLIGTGNPITRFSRCHCWIVTVLLFSRHIFFEVSGYERRFWTELLNMPDDWFVAVPVFYFVLSLVLAFLIKRFILDRGRNKPA